MLLKLYNNVYLRANTVSATLQLCSLNLCLHVDNQLLEYINLQQQTFSLPPQLLQLFPHLKQFTAFQINFTILNQNFLRRRTCVERNSDILHVPSSVEDLILP